MNTNWNLDNIYPSVDSTEFKTDIENCRKAVDNLNKWCSENFTNTNNPQEKLEKYIELKNSVLAYEKLGMYINLALAVDTTNSELAKALDTVENIESNTAYENTMLIEFLKQVKDIDKLVENSPILKEHSFFITEKVNMSSHTLSPQQEEIIAKMKTTGSNMWEKLWDQISSTLEVDYNGKKEPLSIVRNLAYSDDPDVRKNAYKAELEAYKKIDMSSAFCLNGIKGQVITTSKLHNYSSPLEQTLADSRIDSTILNAMFSAIDKKLPALRKYFIKKSQYLGGSGSLAFYDLFAPVGKEDLKYTLEEAKAFVLKCFYKFSKDLGDFATYAFDNQWIDLMPKKGKVGGAFCETIHSIKESRILTNFGGTFNDVVTIAHELGHAFHNTRLFHLSQINSFYPMPIAETASNFCETIVVNEALKEADENSALIIRENDLQGATQCIIDIYSRFLFEDSVFKAREKGSLSPEECCGLMIDAQKKSYGEGLDENYLHPYMWVCKPHYYDADFNYYNFPYAFGLLLAKGLYSLYLEDKERFIPLYDKFLSASSTMELKDVAKIAGFDLTTEDFWLKGLEQIEKEIEEF